MKFDLIDKIIEQTDTKIIAIKTVTKAEEYLQDHFPTFPVLPGVLMIETMVQAARKLLEKTASNPRLVLNEVNALRYGSFVKPGQALKVEVVYNGQDSQGNYKCKGIGNVIDTSTQTENKPLNDTANALTAKTAVSGRFTLRAINITAEE